MFIRISMITPHTSLMISARLDCSAVLTNLLVMVTHTFMLYILSWEYHDMTVNIFYDMGG